MATNDFVVKNGLVVNENATIKEATDASSATDTAASVYTAGGLAIAKKAYVGTNLDVQGTSNLVGNITAGGNIIATGDIAVNGGDITTTNGAATLFNTGAITVNAFGAATTVNLGAATGTTTVNNSLTVTQTTTLNGASNLSPNNLNVVISPTGTGTIIIAPTAVGSINNTSIGATTRSSGAFTTLTANNAVTFTANTSSSSSTSGTLVVTGGVGISGNANIAGSVNANNQSTFAVNSGLSFPSYTASAFFSNTGSSTSAIIVGTAGGSTIDLVNNNGTAVLNVVNTQVLSATNSAITLPLTADSSSTTTGALIVNGGVGIAKNLYAGAAVRFNAGTASTSSTTGTLVVSGGVGITGALYVGSSSTFAGLSSTSTTTLSPANASVLISPTGTGSVTIGPATAGTINNMSIGASTRASGAFTTLAANSTVSIDTTSANQSYTTTGTATITLTSGGTGTINNISIGATTAATGRFTTIESTIANGTAPLTVASSTKVTNLNADLLDGIDSARIVYGTNGSGSNTMAAVQNVYEVPQYKSGFWEANGASWTPDSAWWWGFTTAHTSNSASYNYSGQLAFQNGGGGDVIYARTISGGTPSTWSKLLSSGNYNSYSPKLDGTGATGTWSINVTGNSGTVTNGLYTTGGQTITTRNTHQGSQTDTLRTANGSLGGLELYSNGSGAAFMAFHRPGVFASYFGLDTDNYFAVGGWSYGAGLGNFKANLISAATVTANLTGNVTGNVSGSSGSTTGNAASVTNGVYTVGDQTVGGIKTFSSNIIGNAGVIASSGQAIRARYDGADNYAAHMWWNGIQLGNNGDNYIFGGRNSGGGNLKFYTNQTNGSTTGQPTINGNLALTLNSNGTALFGYDVTVSGSFTENSSLRYKENVNPIDSALDKVLQLQGVTYDKKDGSAKDEPGLIAEDVLAVLPNLVQLDQEGRADGIHYTKITAYLIECIKELNAKIDKLEGKNV